MMKDYLAIEESLSEPFKCEFQYNKDLSVAIGGHTFQSKDYELVLPKNIADNATLARATRLIAKHQGNIEPGKRYFLGFEGLRQMGINEKL